MTIGAVSNRVTAELDAMTDVIAQLPERSRGPNVVKAPGVNSPDGAVPESRAATEADFRVLESLLLRLDPASAWGSLSRTVTPEGLTLYLCREHSLAYRRTARL
jgi:internalin A